MRIPRRVAAASPLTTVTGVEITSGARARYDQDDQRLVDAAQPRPTEQQRPRQREAQRQHEDRRGVDRGKPVDEALGGCTGTFGGLDGVDDASQNGIGRRCGDFKLESRVLVDGASEHLIARPLLHRHAFSGHR